MNRSTLTRPAPTTSPAPVAPVAPPAPLAPVAPPAPVRRSRRPLLFGAAAAGLGLLGAVTIALVVGTTGTPAPSTAVATTPIPKITELAGGPDVAERRGIERAYAGGVDVIERRVLAARSAAVGDLAGGPDVAERRGIEFSYAGGSDVAERRAAQG